jgi:hypothetical protein
MKILAIALLVALTTSASAEICLKKPDHTSIEKRGGYRWLWRFVDEKKCWYYSNLVMPREELVWSFTEEEFNSDIDRILERKFYKPILDENQLLIEAD